MNYKENRILPSLLYLLELASNKKHSEIKGFLRNGFSPDHARDVKKAILTESFIAELLIGNNRWARITPVRGDFGIDIIEYTRTGYQPCKCYQIKNQGNLICNADVNNQIEKFKESKYSHLPYYILSISGFGETTITHSNVHLIDYEYVIKWINNYSENLNSTPGSTYLLRDDDFILRFDELLKYIHEFGDCYYDHLPCSIKNLCIKTIEEKRNGKLNIKKVLLLNKIGFCWDHNVYTLNQGSDKIHTKYDSTHIKSTNKYSKNLSLTLESIHLLKDHDFTLEFNELLKYVHKFEACYFYEHLPDNLKKWCCKIRKEKKNGRLDIEEILLLDKIGFCWSHNDYTWNQSFGKINKIYARYGSTYENMEWHLKPWLKRQLGRYLSGDLTSYRIRKLESIDLTNEWLLNI
ncbi:helicase associated domain-containing protein [Clostridium sp. WILCCON 0269]|uniref:Helicase associated domain-containing protein n=1 Tax=Candidatus Clostridium eludens TaxID=3381663 RepID=A0ABW8SJ36_9CLOT